MIGFIVDLFQLGQKPIVTVLAWTLFTGLMAVGYLLVLTRAPRLIFLPIAAHLVGSWIIASSLHYVSSMQVHPTIESGVKIAAVWVLSLSLLACAFFLVFIQGEGRQSVRIQTALALAHRIQETLVPPIDQQLLGMEIYGASVPSDKVGGDLVDVVQLRDGSVIAYVADIAGHGLPAGILMGMLKTAVHTQLPDVPSLTGMFQRLNEVLPALKEPHMYATCTALRILSSGSENSVAVEYAIAGQPPLLHVSASSCRIAMLSDEQFPIGLIADVSYRSQELAVQNGDLLVIATDGLLDAENAKGEPFGLERLSSLLLEGVTASLAEIADRIRNVSRSGYQQVDDQTLMLIRFVSRV